MKLREKIAGTAIAVQSIFGWVAHAARVIAPPLLRVALAVPFFRSGLTKWDGFLSLSPMAAFLFEDEFKLHIFGETYDFPMPEVVAFVVGSAEIVLPTLLVLGLATRLSAFGLLVMTVIIQLVVPDGWANFHLPWAAMAVALVALGPGPFSLDHFVAEQFVGRRRPPDVATGSG